jgi:glutamate-1-semialdehyde 2,1-aminomutase
MQAHRTLAGALEASEQRFAAANPISEKLYRHAGASMPGGNTRSSLYYSPFPLTFSLGDAQHLTDVDGHVYTDFLGDYSAGLYGHSHPRIMEAARAALDVGVALGGPNEYESELAALVKARFPSVDLLRFTNSGTEANLLAITTARVMTGKSHVLVFEGGYHGSLLSFRVSTPMNAPFPFVVCDYNDVEEAVDCIRRHAVDLAAVMVEPMLGGGGAIPGSTEFLRALREETARAGAVLIFDEVMTSRLGPGGLQGEYGIRPDMTTFGKYLGGGFTFGAFGGDRHLMERYDPARPDSLAHPGTFNNTIVTMAAGLAGLRDVYTAETAVAHNARGDAMRDRLNHLFTDTGVAMRATGLGSITGIHFQDGAIHSPKDLVPSESKRALFHLEMMAKGYYLARRGT